MEKKYVMNPKTGRELEVGGATYQRLVKEGVKFQKSYGKVSPKQQPQVDPPKPSNDLWVLIRNINKDTQPNIYFRTYPELVSYLKKYINNPRVAVISPDTKEGYKQTLNDGKGSVFNFQHPTEGKIIFHIYRQLFHK